MSIPIRTTLLALVITLFATTVQAEPYFDSCALKTGRSASLIIPAAAQPTINGEPLAKGSEIAVFTPEGACAGRAMWNEASLAITIWGNDLLTPVKEGLETGDQVSFQIWDSNSKKLYVGPGLVQTSLDSSRTYFRTESTFVEGAIFRVTGLSIDTRHSPALVAPDNGGSIHDHRVALSWRTVNGAARYHLQIATNSTFADPVVDAVVNEAEASVDLDEEATYFWRVGSDGVNGTSWSETYSFTVDANAKATDLPEGFALEQNYPNPFNPATTIPFSLSDDSDVTLEIYNMLGQRVATLVDGYLASGRHEINWNASDQPSGMYIYRLTSGREVRTMTLTLVK